MKADRDQAQRLAALSHIAEREVDVLQRTAGRLFGDRATVRPDEVEAWVGDEVLGERVDAFVARFSRLLDTLGDSFVPTLLACVGAAPGSVVDNLNQAQQFGWLDCAEDWLAYRHLRNQLLHEYIEDAAVLAQALNAGRRHVPVLVETARRLVAETRRRLT